MTGHDYGNPDGKDISPKSVDVDTLTDNQDGGAWETLRELGYESGDFLTIADTGGIDNGEFTTSSGTYQFEPGMSRLLLNTTEIPTNGTLKLGMYFRTTQLNGTSVDVRIRDINDDATVLEHTGVSQTGAEFTGLASYTPGPDTTRYLFQYRSGNGSSTVGVQFGRMIAGVEL